MATIDVENTGVTFFDYFTLQDILDGGLQLHKKCCFTNGSKQCTTYKVTLGAQDTHEVKKTWSEVYQLGPFAPQQLSRVSFELFAQCFTIDA